MYFLQVISKELVLVTQMGEADGKIFSSQMKVNLSEHDLLIENGKFDGNLISASKIAISSENVKLKHAFKPTIKYCPLKETWLNFSHSVDGRIFKLLITCGRNLKVIK
tara:strand:+ start:11365 stop:11688 length:324 start_codon:yes stop_codon:yes gene_type:complete